MSRDWQTNPQRTQAGSRGFTLVELAVASLILIVGVAAVVQLVPAAMRSNLSNRFDTTATVMAQRYLDLVVTQGITATVINDPTGTFPCGGGGVACLLGDVSQSDVPVGAQLLPNGRMDFTVPVEKVPAGYGLRVVDPNDPTGVRYDIRWNVVSVVRPVATNPTMLIAKRVTVGARREGTFPPNSVTLTVWLSR